jgi:nitrogen fixation protein FixH
MTRKDLVSWISRYRWPLGVVAILSSSIVAQGTMVYFATRQDAPRPLKDYYEKAQAWEVDQAVVAASRQLGWAVAMEIPEVPVEPGQPRPVDVAVTDRDGRPVDHLAGDVVAVRPADGRMNTRGRLVELPQSPGRYRTLVALPAKGLWEMSLDAAREGQRFVHTARVTVP